MAFPVNLTAALTGTTVNQLAYWRRGKRILAPEYGIRPQALYSFRDLVALRTVAKPRSEGSLQAIRRAFATLREYDLTDHPSSYALFRHGNSIVLRQGEQAMDLVQSPGTLLLVTVEDVFAGFTNAAGRSVLDFRNPRPNLEVRERRIGGWPTAAGTRVPYDDVAALMATGEVAPEEVSNYFPTVSAAAARDAADFESEVRELGRSA